MKFSYAIDTERQLITQRFEGTLTLERLLECLRQLWADPTYSPAYNGLVDMSKALPKASVEDLPRLVAFVLTRPERSRGRWAAVTNSPFLTACGMLYQKAVVSQHVFEVFSTDEAARAFLRLDPPPAATAL